MLLSEFDRFLAEATEERNRDIAALEYVLETLESFLAEANTKIIDDLCRERGIKDDYKKCLYKYLNKYRLIGDDDAVAIGLEALEKSVSKLDPKMPDAAKYTFVENAITRDLQTHITYLKKKGFNFRGTKDGEDKSRDIKPSFVSSNTALKNKDGSDGDALIDTFGDDNDSPEENFARKDVSEKVKRKINELPDSIAKKIALMMISDEKYNPETRGFQTNIARDWWKWDKKHGEEDRLIIYTKQFNTTPEQAIENGVKASTIEKHWERAQKLLRTVLADLKESKIDVLGLYINETLRIA